jgi:hypothetical protein
MRIHRASRCVWRPPLTGPLLVCCLLCAPSPAGAASGDWVVGLAPSYAYIVLHGTGEPDGGGSGLFVHYGLSDAVAIQLSGLWTVHDIEGTEENEGGLYHVVNVAAGVRYAFDVLKVNPALEVAAGILYLRFHGDSAVNLGLLMGICVDWWALDWLAVGAAFHYHAFLSNPNEYPVYFDAGPRVAFRWR